MGQDVVAYCGDSNSAKARLDKLLREVRNRCVGISVDSTKFEMQKNMRALEVSQAHDEV